jgi:hypothetical protein
VNLEGKIPNSSVANLPKLNCYFQVANITKLCFFDELIFILKKIIYFCIRAYKQEKLFLSSG